MLLHEYMHTGWPLEMQRAHDEKCRDIGSEYVKNLRKPLPVPVINEQTKPYWELVAARFKLACESGGIPYEPGPVEPSEAALDAVRAERNGR